MSLSIQVAFVMAEPQWELPTYNFLKIQIYRKMSERICNKVLTRITLTELRGSFTVFMGHAMTLSKKKKLIKGI